MQAVRPSNAARLRSGRYAVTAWFTNHGSVGDDLYLLVHRRVWRPRRRHRWTSNGQAWTGCPSSGQAGEEMLAGLTFRIGRADESLARGGVTHMIEHLALYPVGVEAAKHYNGQVDAVTTMFLRRGSCRGDRGVFRAVCANLRELPVERLEREKQVLRTEAGGRRPAITDPLFTERYGADTYGLPSYPEYGLSAVQAADLKAWSGRYFTRGNAALWVAGEAAERARPGPAGRGRDASPAAVVGHLRRRPTRTRPRRGWPRSRWWAAARGADVRRHPRPPAAAGAAARASARLLAFGRVCGQGPAGGARARGRGRPARRAFPAGVGVHPGNRAAGGEGRQRG